MPKRDATVSRPSLKKSSEVNSPIQQVSPSLLLSKLSLGALVQISSPEDHLKYLTRLLGSDSTRTLITALPTPKQLKKETVSVIYDNLFFPEKKIIMRLIAQGSVYAFESEVTAINYNGCKLLLSSFPKAIQSQTLRGDTRFPCTLLAKCFIADYRFDAVIVDISHGGCQIQCNPIDLKIPIEELKEQALNLAIRFNRDENTHDMKCIVIATQKIERDKISIRLAYRQVEPSVTDYLDSLQLGDMSSMFL